MPESRPEGDRVAICIITFQRPVGLARLLLALEQLRFRRERPSVEIVVVDNDVEESARSVCERFEKLLRWPLRYRVQPIRGIPCARNMAVSMVSSRTDFVAFVDDDEVPEPVWLDELLWVRRKHAADLVAGPVIPWFEVAPPDWVKQGHFFERSRWSTGTPIFRAHTGNMLVRRHLLGGIRPFDERLALTGGSDSLLTRRLCRQGVRAVWADKAVVSEWVPMSRVNARWICERSFRTGANLTFIRKEFHALPRAWGATAAFSVVWVVAASLQVPQALLGEPARAIEGSRCLCRALGLVAGLLGVRFDEYKRVHGE